MKKFATVSVAFLLSIFFLLSCGQGKTYDEGFEDGYDMGYYDASVDFEDDYARGYDDGHSDGYREGYDDSKIEFGLNLILEAEKFAREATGCHPMEAMDIIGVYRNPNSPHYSGIIITEEEYHEAVDALCYFYEYLDSTNFFD